jgi:pimeloyl-ACP methyl ester carboxylesterase
MRVYRSGRARVALLSSLRGLMADHADAFWERVRTIEAPALILFGDRDRLVPHRLGELLASAMPAGELASLPGVGHVPQFEVPETTIELVRGFLEGLGQAAEPAPTSSTRKHAPLGGFGT